MKLDPVIKNYLASERKNPIVVFVKLKSKEFEYSKILASNARINPKQTMFKKEVDALFSQFKNYTINSYLHNISLIEVVLEKEDVNKLTQNPLISGIQAIRERI